MLEVGARTRGSWLEGDERGVLLLLAVQDEGRGRRGRVEAHTGGAREDEVVGSTGLDLVVGEEGREEATMDREEKVVGSVCKSRRWVDRLDGWIEGIPRRRWVCGGGGMGRMGQDA